jgi:tripartite-type tricarboxylate transporter receptor subunit TctC
MKRKVCLKIAALVCIALAPAVSAQNFPTKPIHLIVEFAPGTGGDLYLRKAFTAVATVVGQPVVIDNRAGAGGVLAAETVAHATPDGYTLLAASQNVPLIRPFLSKSNTVTLFKDLMPVTQVYKSTTLIVANPQLPVKSLPDFIAYAKANPGKISFGSSGFGSSHHFTGEELQLLAGVKMVHVAYKGGVQSMQAAATGETQISIGFAETAMPIVRAGKVRVLAIVEGQPAGELADVPLASKQIPGFEPLPSWAGLFAPGGIPPLLLQRLNTMIVKGLNLPEAKTESELTQPIADSSASFGATLKKQYALIAKIAKAANITPKDD